MASPFVELPVGDRLVKVTNPDRVYFAERGETKLDLVNYYLSVGPGIVRALRERPCWRPWARVRSSSSTPISTPSI